MGFKDKKFDIVIGNPPYDKNLHLKIIEKSLTLLDENGKACFIHPARWIEDPLWEYKRGSDRKKFNDSIVSHIKNYEILNVNKINKLFNIQNSTNLMISLIDKNIYSHDKYINLTQIEKQIINKILSYSVHNNISEHIEQNKIDGIRIKSCFILHGSPRNSDRNDSCNIFYSTDEPLINGFTQSGRFFNSTGQMKNKTVLPLSIKFNSIDEAQNYLDSLKTNFFKNLVKLLILDVNVQYQALPWMYDYTSKWTDERFCKFFDLTKDESIYMSSFDK